MSTDWEKLFKMKQDDWIDACKEIDQANAKLADMKSTIFFLKGYALGMAQLANASKRAHEELGFIDKKYWDESKENDKEPNELPIKKEGK